MDICKHLRLLLPEKEFDCALKDKHPKCDCENCPDYEREKVWWQEVVFLGDKEIKLDFCG